MSLFNHGTITVSIINLLVYSQVVADVPTPGLSEDKFDQGPSRIVPYGLTSPPVTVDGSKTNSRNAVLIINNTNTKNKARQTNKIS